MKSIKIATARERAEQAICYRGVAGMPNSTVNSISNTVVMSLHARSRNTHNELL